MSIVTRFRAARREDREGGIALLMVILLMFITLAIGTAMLGVLVSQAKQTRFNNKDVQTISAAEAGVQDAFAQIREANVGGSGTYPAGDFTQLPCGPFTGSVPGTSESYSVSVAYYDTKPTTYVQSDNQTWLSANALTCSHGITLPSGTTDLYAVLTSQGQGTALPGLNATFGDRNIQIVYDFNTEDTNLDGGQIMNYVSPSSSQVQMCLDAGPDPTVGTLVTMQSCGSSTTDLQQLWSYLPTLQLELTESALDGGTALCLDDPNQNSGDYIELNDCDSSSASDFYTQQWSFNDTAQFQDATSSAGLGSLVMQIVSPQTAGSLVEAGSSGTNAGYSDAWAWDPSPKVGAGAAEGSNPSDPDQPTTSDQVQLVNYLEFGRCLDVSDQNPAAPDLIDFPCKQDPNPADVAWNQKFFYSSTTGEIWTVTGGVNYCLKSTDTASSTAYSTFTPCPTGSASVPADETWTMNEDTGDDSTSYQIIDNEGNCLSISTPDGAWDSNLAQWSSIVTNTCLAPGTAGYGGTTGGNSDTAAYLGQKWNAPPDQNTAKAHDETEETGG